MPENILPKRKSRRKARQTYYVCVGLKNNQLFNKNISADTSLEAKRSFKAEYGFFPSFISEPLYKKRNNSIPKENQQVSIQFDPTAKSQTAIYQNEWIVNSFALLEPAEHVYLVFIERLSNKNTPLPKGNIVVPNTDIIIKEII